MSRLRVYNGNTGCEPATAHRSMSPVRSMTPELQPPRPGPSVSDRVARQLIQAGTIDDDVRAAAAQMAGSTQPQVVPEHERATYRQMTSLRQFYTEWLLVERSQKVERSDLSAGSLSKDRQSLNRFERYTRPHDWPDTRHWPGPPLGLVTQQLLEIMFDRARVDGLAVGTIKTWWNSLKTILNRAVKVRAIDALPDPSLPKSRARRDVLLWSEPEMELIFGRLAATPDLQVAWVVSCCTGIRPVDLFLLNWMAAAIDPDERQNVEFLARKTGKQQRIPLAPCAAAHLRRLRALIPDEATRDQRRMIFPGRTSAHSKDPERSRPARARQDLIKHLILELGDSVRMKACGECPQFTRDCANCWAAFKPWQRCRATFNERIEEHAPGAGQFFLGHGLTLNATSYRNPTEMLYEAARTLPQPSAFLKIME